MIANTNIKLKSRKSTILSNFRGVDFSSSAVEIRSNRASYAQNFISDFGVNRKRHGWRGLNTPTISLRINGIFHYKNGEDEKILVHRGTTLREMVKSVNGLYDFPSNPAVYPVMDGVLDQRSQAFYQKGKLYIIGCGDYIVFGKYGDKYEFRKVEDDEDTYIPTTTINIDKDTVSDQRVATLDAVNMLSSKRRNTLVGASATTTSPVTWTLDTTIDGNSLVKITGVITSSNTHIEIYNKTPSGNNLYYTTALGEEKLCGSITRSISTNSGERARVKLTINTLPPVSNESNLTVEFKHTTTNKINGCKFGCIFGINGNTNRLFVSGNDNYKNYDFYSEEEDFTYFPDINYMGLGSDNLAITGYSRLSDSTLCIYKEEGNGEPTVFYRSGKLVENDTVFPTFAGAVGEGVVSFHACANLSGDSLIVSKNGVFGVVLSNNVATTERYTRERSRLINGELTKHDLSNAVACVYKNKYLLSVDGAVYVADARYKYSASDDIDGSFNYEWWYLTNINARVFAVINDELYFGTDKGLIAKFDDEFTDRTYSDVRLSENATENYLSISYGNAPKDGDKISFYSKKLFSLIASDVIVSDGKVFVDDLKYVFDGLEVFVDEVGASGLSVNTPYTVSEIDLDEKSFRLTDSTGNPVSPVVGGFRVFENVSTAYVVNATSTEFQIKKYRDGNILNLKVYNETVETNLWGLVEHADNVVAEWYTPVLDMGTNESSKTLLKMTIATDPDINGKVSFGYETRKAASLINAKGISFFDLNDLSFENFSLDTAFANSYTTRCNERNFNYIMFRFRSDNDANCIVNSMTVQYKINTSNKGVR